LVTLPPGGRVEAIECGVFRADFPERFRLDPEARVVKLRIPENKKKVILKFFLNISNS